jgi:D-alanine-D-alanine ligase
VSEKWNAAGAEDNWQIALQSPVAVLLGGDSAERAVSLRTGQAIVAALKMQNINAVAIDTGEPKWMYEVLGNYQHAFIALHGCGGEDGRIQGFLDYAGISYTGSGVMASALAMDKVRTKLLWRGLGLATPAFKLLETIDDCEGVLNQWSRAVVKPVHEGSSIGISIVSSYEELLSAYREAQRYDGAIMVEQYISGAEYTVAIVGEQVLPAIRLETDHAFYDYDAKYESDSTRYFSPSGLSVQREQDLQELALKAYRAIGCSGWGRVDIMQDETGEFSLLEVNTVPGMTDHSLVPMAAKAVGVEFDLLVATILRLSLVEKN